MAEQQELDRNEPPTEHKLRKAHQKGSIFRSADVTFFGVLCATLLCLWGLGASSLARLGLLVQNGLSGVARTELNEATALAHIGALSAQVGAALAPIGFVVWLAACGTAALQARGVFSAQPLVPDFSRLNPATGFKRLLSKKSLHDLWRSGAKLAVFSLAAWGWISDHGADLLRLMVLGKRPLAASLLELTGSLLALLTGLMLLFALLEWALNREQFMQTMKMSKREIKDEHKEREGDPRIKSRLRELRLQWLQRARQLSRVRDADVLLTNPTHYAVALQYDASQMASPKITARGAGELAHRMRGEARRHGVPVVQNPPLARALFALRESDAYVPPEHFTSVARILRWVYAARPATRAARGANA